MKEEFYIHFEILLMDGSQQNGIQISNSSFLELFIKIKGTHAHEKKNRYS
jgi:hypothetical protein